jgi:MurNAc alpha-1-phosphate uridylyltransferase
MIRRAMIFAAGRGERMRPLTDATPKPLLRIGGKMLIEHHLEKLAAAGVREVVINTSHLAEQFPAALGDGTRWGVSIRYSYEGPQPLETGGGIRHALPLLGAEPFIGVAADIVSDYDYAVLPAEPDGLAHLVMVPNPAFHPRGDFWLDGMRLNEDGAGERLTFSSIGVYRPALVAGETAAAFKLLPHFQHAMRDGKLSGERYDGLWINVGTPGQLREAQEQLAR